MSGPTGEVTSGACGQELSDVGPGGGTGPVPEPQRRADEGPLPVDDESRRQGHHPVALPDRSITVQQHGNGEAELAHEAPDDGVRLSVVDGQNGEPAASELPGESLDGRDLVPAGSAPGGPEVHQHYAAPEVLEADRAALEVGELERRRRFGRVKPHDVEGLGTGGPAAGVPPPGGGHQQGPPPDDPALSPSPAPRRPGGGARPTADP